MCRAGITEFEHIIPPFSEATEHNPEKICLLCSSCHDKVTRGHLSKKSVADAYRRIAAANWQDVQPPKDYFDFSSRTAKLDIGGFAFKGEAPIILKYLGDPLIEVIPATEDVPFGLNARFFNGLGEKTLEIEHNVWVGPKNGGDFHVTGQRLYVKDKDGLNSLVLRVDPPNGLIIEKIDMRIGSYHLLANQNRHAIGYYEPDCDNDPIWYNCFAVPTTLYAGASVFEIEEKEKLRDRFESLREQRKCMDHPEQGFVMSEFFGIGSIKHGIVFCSNSGFDFYNFSRGRHTLENARSAVFTEDKLDMAYILSRGGDPLAYDVGAQARDFPDTLKQGEGAAVLIDYSNIGHPDLQWPR
jgi:hypothetical protein